MSKSQKDLNIVTHTTELNPKLLTDVRKSIVVIRDIPVIADADVAPHTTMELHLMIWMRIKYVVFFKLPVQNEIFHFR
mgnify:CR=1 FL=1